MNEKTEGPVLKLPKNDVLRARLAKKLEEYRERVTEEQGTDYPVFAHFTKPAYRDAFYKEMVLERLLNNGEVKCWDLSREFCFSNPYDEIDILAFSNACSVVKYYCTGREHEVTGGNGLPLT